MYLFKFYSYIVLGDYVGSARFPLAIVMQLTLCSQGFATCVIYGGLATKLLSLCKRKPPTVSYKEITPPVFPITDDASSGQPRKSFGQPASIFVSTFNMGEGKLTKTELVSSMLVPIYVWC